MGMKKKKNEKKNAYTKPVSGVCGRERARATKKSRSVYKYANTKWETCHSSGLLKWEKLLHNNSKYTNN